MRAGRLARLCVVAAVAGTVLLATAAPAWAHATLQSTDPPADGVVARSPRQLSLTFSENVEVSFGAVRVFTCAGQRITPGSPHHAATSQRTVVVSVPKLAAGVYLVSWRVVSADAHPVNGTYSFRIGPGAAPSVNGCTAETTTKSSATVGMLFGLARGGVFAGLALLIGGAVFLLLIARGSSAARSTRRAVWIGWIVLVLATVGALILQGPYAAGSGIGDAAKWSVVHDVLQTRFGHVTEVRLVLLAAALALLPFLASSAPNRRPALWSMIVAAIVAMRPARTATSARTTAPPVPSTRSPPRITRSYMHR